MVPAAPSPSLKTPEKSLAAHVAVLTTVVVVVVAGAMVVVDGGTPVVVVLDVGSMTCRLSVKITTKAAKMATETRPRLTDQSPRAESYRGTLAAPRRGPLRSAGGGRLCVRLFLAQDG